MSNGFISQAEFTSACNVLPLVSIDFVVYAKTGRVLLGLRNNAPAQGFWFTPGGRIRKNEAHAEAMRRVAISELGDPLLVVNAQLMGVWDHFYEDSAFSEQVSTHYVNLPYFVRVEKEFEPPFEAQHMNWSWVKVAEAVEDVAIHSYARAYLRWVLERVEGGING